MVIYVFHGPFTLPPKILRTPVTSHQVGVKENGLPWLELQELLPQVLLSEQELRVELLRLWPERTVFFDTCLVRGHGRPYDLRAREGERSMKDNDHHPVHRSVHPSGERKLLGA